MSLTKRQKQAIADAFKATADYYSITSRIDPKKLLNVKPLKEGCIQDKNDSGIKREKNNEKR